MNLLEVRIPSIQVTGHDFDFFLGTTVKGQRCVLVCLKCDQAIERHFLNVRISFLSSASSWDHLRISVGMFRLFCEHLVIFPHFIDVLSGFGRKISELDEQSPACYRQFNHVGTDIIATSCGE